MTAAHGRVEHLEIEHRLGRIELAQLGLAFFLGAAVALQPGGPGFKGVQTLVHQRLQSPLHDQVDERLRRIEAAAVLARVGVEADDDLAAVAANRLAFEQALVDRAELLDGHVAVVDEAALAVDLGVAQVMDDRGERRVGQAHRLQQRSGFGGEQTAVVRRQADRGVAFVD